MKHLAREVKLQFAERASTAERESAVCLLASAGKLAKQNHCGSDSAARMLSVFHIMKLLTDVRVECLAPDHSSCPYFLSQCRRI